MKRDRTGVTLLELTVVFGIIGLLAAVLLPALQHVRETSRQMSCQNNLKQVGLAIQSFEGSAQFLPSLYNGTFIEYPVTQWDEYHFHSWQTAILPQLEQSALYQKIDQKLPATDPANQANVNIELAAFICPSTSNYTPVVLDLAQRDPIIKVGTAARSDYEAVGGLLREPTTGGYGNRSYDYINMGAWGKPQYDRSDDAKFDKLYKTRLQHITDGLSNTIIVGEKSGRPDIYKRGEPDEPYVIDSGGSVGQPAWAISGIYWAIALNERFGVNESNQLGLYSFHPRGVNVVLADGSVRLLSNDTAKEVLHALATRAGGEVVSFGE